MLDIHRVIDERCENFAIVKKNFQIKLMWRQLFKLYISDFYVPLNDLHKFSNNLDFKKIRDHLMELN